MPGGWFQPATPPQRPPVPETAPSPQPSAPEPVLARGLPKPAPDDNPIPIRPARARAAAPRAVIIHRAKPPATGANRTASRWKNSILIRRDMWGARLLSCACPNHPKLPIRSPACRQHHLHCRRCKTLGRFRPAFLAGSAKPPKMDKQQAVGGIMIGLKSALCLAMLMLPLALGGCAGVLLVGGLAGVAGGGYAAAQERGVGGAVSDLQIETNY